MGDELGRAWAPALVTQPVLSRARQGLDEVHGTGVVADAVPHRIERVQAVEAQPDRLALAYGPARPSAIDGDEDLGRKAVAPSPRFRARQQVEVPLAGAPPREVARC